MTETGVPGRDRWGLRGFDPEAPNRSVGAEGELKRERNVSAGGRMNPSDKILCLFVFFAYESC